MRKIADDQELTGAVIEKQYILSDKIILDIDQLSDFNIKNRNNITIIHHKKEILIESSGVDPYFSVPFHPDQDNDRVWHYLVEVEITSPEDTVFAMYFTTADVSDTFTEQQKVEEKIHKGENRLLFRLPHPHVAGMIRIDPGKTAGRYVLHSFTIKAVPEKSATDTAFQPDKMP